jgi:acyl-CoA synthetase (AMP-forming)/AMP-acid ligase II
MNEQQLELTWQYVDKWAAERPDAEAIVFEDIRLTWREFKDRMDRTAKAFLDAGIGKGDCIAMIAMARHEFLITFMAANKIGAVWLGLSPKFTVHELRYIIDDSQPSLLISLHSYGGKDLTEDGIALVREFSYLKKILLLGEAPAQATSFDAFVNTPRPYLDHALAARASGVQPEDDALLLYTSGSTGKPKGVVHTHKSIIANIREEVTHFGFHAGSRTLIHFPINHVAATIEIGFATIFGGGCAVCIDHFHPQSSLEIIEREGVTVVGQVPAMFLLQFQAPKFQQMDWSKVEAFVWSGAAAPAAMVDALGAIAAHTGARLITGYGSTEVAGFVTYTQPDDDRDTLVQTAGRIVPPFELKLVDERRQTVSAGQLGEIAVRGACIMSRYHRLPDVTASVIDAEGWYYTGDLATNDERGYITIVGRQSEMFKTGGENIFPREIEDTLEHHPAVALAAVIGVPDDVYQETGRAYVLIKPGHNVTAEELHDHCRTRLANFKIPKEFEIRDQLPLLPTGKVNKVVLKGEYISQRTPRG